jgi:hypothetical protein
LSSPEESSRTMEEPRPSTGASALVNIMDQLDNFEYAVLQPTRYVLYHIVRVDFCVRP